MELTPKSSSLWIEIERYKKTASPKKKIVTSPEEAAILLLSHFAKTPRISFGTVKLSTSKEEILRIRNPADYCQIVVVEKVPEEKGFSADTSLFEIEANVEKTFAITWTPTSVGNYRELITFRVDGLFHKQVILLGTAVSPIQKVLQTQNGSTNTKGAPVDKSLGLNRRSKRNVLKIKKTPKNVENQNVNDKLSSKTFLCKETQTKRIIFGTNEEVTVRAPSQSRSINSNAENVPNTRNRSFSPEISRAFRNQLKCPAQQKSTLRPTREVRRSDSQLLNAPVDSIVGNGVGLPTLSHTSTSELNAETFQTDSVLPSCEINSTEDRRQTYISQSATSLNSAAQFEAAGGIPTRRLSDSPDRRHTYSLRSAVSLNAVETTSAQKFIVNELPTCGVPDTPERRQTFTKECPPSCVAIPTISSPILFVEHSNENSHPNRTFRCRRKTKIPEPLCPNQKRRSRDRRKCSDIHELNDSLEEDSLSDSNIPVDHQEIVAKLNKSVQQLNDSLEMLSQIPANDNYRVNSKEQVVSAEEKAMQITGLDYSNFCKVLTEDSESPEWGATQIVQEKEDGTSDSFCTKRCSTEIKFIGRKESQRSIDSCKQLFPEAETPKTQQSGSKTFVVTSPPLAVPLDTVEENEESSGKDSTFSNAKRQVNEKNIITKLKGKKQSQSKRRNASKTSSDSQSSKDDRSGSSPQNSRASSRKRTSRLNQTKKNEMPGKLKLIKPPESTKVKTPRHPNPYAAKNIYYDEQWIEKQTQGFKRWLNFILTIPDELSANEQQVYVSKSYAEISRDTTFKQAPSREVLSLRAYTAHKRMNLLRRRACGLYESEAMVKVITRLEHEIENKRIIIRSDKALHADIGIKQKLLDLVLNYNTLWLRIGLETVFGQILQLQSNDDTEGLSQFILKNLLNCPSIAKEYAHTTVPHLFKSGYPTALKKHTLKKFLLLVYFLDQAKEDHLINYNPCLFRSDAKYKSSRDLLLAFSRDHLSGEGDVTKHLAFFGYKVTHSQTVLDEYDFSVTNLATDLRNGLRLARAAQLLTKNWNLMSRLRVPAVSRMQKIHNVTCVLNALAEFGTPIVDVTAKHIVNGHCEKTLSFLWQLILNFQLNVVINEEKLKREIAYLRRKSRGTRISELFVGSDELYQEGKIKLLLLWCQLVCASHNLQVENFTVSFSDARAICYLIHHYHPTLLPVDQIRTETTQTYFFQQNASLSSEDSFGANWTTAAIPTEKYDELLENEKENFKLALQKIAAFGGIPLMIRPSFMSNTIPDEKVTMVFISYLCSRFLDLSEEMRAAKVIQNAWRKRRENSQREREKVQTQAASVIQRVLLKFCASTRKDLAKQENAALKIQNWYRARQSRHKFAKTKIGVIRLQAIIRSFLTRRRLKNKICLKQTAAAIIIQKWVRAYIVRKRYVELRHATICLQRRIKRKQMEIQHERENTAAACIQRYLKTIVFEKAMAKQTCFCIKLQSRVRGFLLRKGIEEVKLAIRKSDETKAATCIQSLWRMHSCRKEYVKKLNAAVRIQLFYATKLRRKWFLSRRESAVKIQRWYRSCRETRSTRADYLKLRDSTIVIQSHVRRWIHETRLRRKKKAAVTIQRYYKKQLLRRQIEREKRAASTLQRWIRGYFRTKTKRAFFLRLKSACVIIQKNWRRRVVRIRLARMKAAAIVIQKNIRRRICQHDYSVKKQAAIVIQKRWRGVVTKRNFDAMKKSAVIVQSVFRCLLKRKEFLIKRSCTAKIQRWYRGYRKMQFERSKFEAKRRATICIQAWVRRYMEVKKYNSIRKAVVAIQTHHRRLQIDHWTRLRFWAIAVLQLYIRVYVKGLRQRKKFILMKNAAITLQKDFRAWKYRRDFLTQKNAAVVIQKHWRGLRERRRFNAKKQAVAVITEWFLTWRLTKCLRLHFLVLRRATVIIQSVWRGFRDRKRINVEIKAATTIQRWFRQTSHARKCREEFLKRKNAAVKIQSAMRSYRVRRNIFYQNEAAVVIQSVYRMWTQKRKYEREKSSAIIIQRFWRGWQLALFCRTRFLYTKYCCICIQATVRCFIERKRFGRMQKAARIIQQAWRYYAACKRGYFEYHIQRGAAIVIQSHFRGHRVRRIISSMLKQERRHVLSSMDYYDNIMKVRRWKDFHVVRGAAITVQSWIRGWLVRRHISESKIVNRLEFDESARTREEEFDAAVIGMQAVVRGNLARRELEFQRCVCGKYRCKTFVNVNSENCIPMLRAVRIVENCYQSIKVTRMLLMTSHELRRTPCSKSTRRLFKDRRRFLYSRIAAVTIQRFWRASVEIRYVRKEFLRLRSAVIILQAAFRGYLTRKRYMELKDRRAKTEFDALKEFEMIEEKIKSRNSYLLCFATAAKLQLKAIFLQRKVRQYQKRKINRAASLIQAAWRGYLLRSKIDDKRVSNVRNRILEVNQSAVLENTLLHRTTRSLDYLFHCRNLSTVWTALNNLNAASRLSSVCCERLSESGGIAVIYQLIHGCNRSLPHMEVIIECLSILLNVAKHTPTRQHVWKVKDSVLFIINLMRIYYEKNDKIILKCCSLIWTLALDEACVKEIKRDEVLKKRISNLCAVVGRRCGGARSASHHSNSTAHNIVATRQFRPEWNLAQGREVEFTKSLQAMTLIVNLFNSWV